MTMKKLYIKMSISYLRKSITKIESNTIRYISNMLVTISKNNNLKANSKLKIIERSSHNTKKLKNNYSPIF